MAVGSDMSDEGGGERNNRRRQGSAHSSFTVPDGSSRDCFAFLFACLCFGSDIGDWVENKMHGNGSFLASTGDRCVNTHTRRSIRACGLRLCLGCSQSLPRHDSHLFFFALLIIRVFPLFSHARQLHGRVPQRSLPERAGPLDRADARELAAVDPAIGREAPVARTLASPPMQLFVQF